MAYVLNLGPWGSVFAVPTSLVDRHLMLAGKEQLQSILWMLRHSGDPFTPEDLAKALNVSVDTALDCVDYWVSQGLLTGSDETPTPAHPAQDHPPAVQETAPVAAMPAVPKTRLPKPDSLYLAKRTQESQEIRFLLEEAQNIVGILSPAMSTALLAAHDDLGLPVPVLVMMLTYAKKVGKANAHYMESLCRDWAEAGINTPAAADEKLRELDERRQAWNAVSAALGLTRRSPSKKEEDASARWVLQWHFSPEMITAAYDRCVDHTGKYSAAYMDKILGRWHQEGLTTPQAVEAEENARKTAAQPGKTYAIDQVEEMSFFDVTED